MDLIKRLVVDLLRGGAVGIANIIPGVSGGTMALILGIYERLIAAIGNLGPGTVKSCLKGRKAFVEELRRIDALFLGTLGVGAAVIIVVVASRMEYLLLKQHDPTYGFFFGLVLASVVVPYRMIRRKSFGAVIAAALAVVMVVGLTLAMSGEQQLKNARDKKCIKIAAKQAKAAAKSGTGAAVAVTLPAGCEGVKAGATAGKRVNVDVRQLVLFFVAGAIAISAMILPGISGSFMLLLMGIYFDMLNCINTVRVGITARQWSEITEPAILLAVFSLGCLIGLLVFTRLLKFLLARFHDVTLAYLTGLIIGSLYAIWPFKHWEYDLPGEHQARVDMHNILPQGFSTNEIITVATVLLGAALVAGFIWIEIKQGKAKKA